MSNERGAIRNLQRYKQLLSFEGMQRRRKITPTDIDGCIDYGGNAFFYIEGKTIGAPFHYGQKLALKNIVDSHEKAGHPSCAVVFEHSVPPEQEIPVCEMTVTKLYFDSGWHEYANSSYTVLDVVERFEKYCELKNVDI